MEGSHILEREEVDRQVVAGKNILAMRMLLPLLRTGLHQSERGPDRFPPASGSWTEEMRLSSQSARRILTDPEGLSTGQRHRLFEKHRQ